MVKNLKTVPSKSSKIMLIWIMFFSNSTLCNLLLCTSILSLFSAFLDYKFNSKSGSLRQACTQDIITQYFVILGLRCYVNYALDVMCCFCRYFSGKFIDHFILEEKQSIPFNRFQSKTPEGHNTDMYTRRHAYVRLIELCVFSVPINLINGLVNIITIITLQPSKICRNSVILCMVVSVYVIVTMMATEHRKRLRDVFNDSKIQKNSSCSDSMNAYEDILANKQHKWFCERFLSVLRYSSASECRYHRVSECYRFLTRICIVAFKLFFVFLKLGDKELLLAEILCRIGEVNLNILCLRNDMFMIIEYWNEYRIESAGESNVIVSTGMTRNVCLELPDQKLVLPFGTKTLIVDKHPCGNNNTSQAIFGPLSKRFRVSVNGLDLHDLDSNSLSHLISILPLQQCLFNKSISFNLRYGTDLTHSQLKTRLEHIGFAEYFDSFPDGLGTIVGTKSCGLSCGQRQVICILRCLFKDVPLYLLNEPMIFLDEDIEIKILELIHSLNDKTFIVYSQARKYPNIFDHVFEAKYEIN